MNTTRPAVLAAIESVIARQFGVRAERARQFQWPVPQEIRRAIEAVVRSTLNIRTFSADLYFPSPLRCIVQYDDARRCTRERATLIAAYPPETPLGFDVSRYRTDRARGDIDRAVTEALADLLPPRHGFNPTVRIRADELAERTGPVGDRVADLLSRRLAVHAGTEFQKMIDAAGTKPHRPHRG